MRKEGYENGEKIGYSQTSAMLTELKKQEEFAFLKAADSIALQQSCLLYTSFFNFSSIWTLLADSFVFYMNIWINVHMTI